MKRIAGNVLIGLSIVCLAATVLLIVFWLVEILMGSPENLNEDDRLALTATALFVGVLIILEVAMFLCGRYLRQSSLKSPPEEIVQRRPIRPLPLIIYLAGSLGIGLFASFGFKILPASKALGFLVCQPQVFVQLLFGGILQIKLDGGTMTQALTIAANLLYFPVLFYPVYSIKTMDRTLEVARYKRMKILLILFGGVHILMAMVIAMLIKA
jgi:hypothetical protein